MVRTGARRARLAALALVATLGVAALTQTVMAPPAQAQTPQNSAVYNGTVPNTDAPAYDGITRAVRFLVPNKAGGADASQYASTNGAYSFGWGMNNVSIIDVDQMADSTAMSYAVTLTNTSDEPKTILAQYELRNGGSAAPMTAGTPTSDNANVTATLFNNVLPRIQGTLAPGESVTVTVPVTVANAQTVASWGNIAPFSGGYTQLREQTLQVRDAAGAQTVRNNISVYARFSHRIVNSSGADFFTSGTQYLGTVRTNGTYTTVPAEIQALLPNMAASDFTSENVYRTMPASSASRASPRTSWPTAPTIPPNTPGASTSSTPRRSRRHWRTRDGRSTI